MSINLLNFDSKVSDNSLISSKDKADHATATQKQKQQNRILNHIWFLSCISFSICMTLSASILKQDLGKLLDEDMFNLNYLVSYYAISEYCVSILWGVASDRIGRKKVLNISLIGSALSMALYGFCNSFSSLAFINVLLGVFSHSSIFIKTMVGESNCKESRPEAFSSLTITLYIASFFGFSISNFFYYPALGINTLSIGGFPHLAPSLIASGIGFAAYIVSDRYLDETLTSKKYSLNGNIITDIPTDQKIILEKSKNIRVFGLKFSENSILLLIVSFLLNLIYSGYSIITQDWPTMDLSKGGLNLKYEYTLLAAPLSPIMMITILDKYPYIHKNIGALKIFKAGFPTVGILLIFSLILTLVAKVGGTFSILSLYYILYSAKTALYTLTIISFNILLSESAEISGNLGTLYGISCTLSGAISFLLPYVFSTFSDLSIENNLPFPFNHSLTWFLTTLSLVGYWLSSKIKHTEE